MVRWLIGGAVIFLCAALEIHGSSLGMYAEILGHPELSDVILVSAACGLILDTIAVNARKDFEIKMNLLKILLDRRT